MNSIDKIAGLKEILALDPKNSFARYGIAMELSARGEIDESLAEFKALLANDPDYTAAYFMAAQVLENAARTSEAIEKLKAGIVGGSFPASDPLSATQPSPSKYDEGRE